MSELLLLHLATVLPVDCAPLGHRAEPQGDEPTVAFFFCELQRSQNTDPKSMLVGGLNFLIKQT